jgi:alpha-2-macroglobulin
MGPRTRLATIALTLSALISIHATAATSGPVAQFSPQGTVKQVRQVTARFAVPMVALGDPRLADPFDIDCKAAGHGRWVDPRNWVYDFDADLPGGLRCTFALRAGLRSRDGAPIDRAERFAFDTGGPSIRASLPQQGSTVDENQVFLFALDSAATTESIERGVYCAVDGISERIPVHVLTGKERAAILDQRRELG